MYSIGNYDWSPLPPHANIPLKEKGDRVTANRNQHLWLARGFLTSALSGPLLASAQTSTPPPTETSDTNEGQVQEVIVTAQRRAERMQDVPIAVTAISAEEVTQKGLTSTLDIAQAIPGLTYTQVIGTAVPRIRGIGSATALGGNENSVATYVDGVYYASSASSLLSLSNIAQVAVLKGPQGTLFGRNATGGLIQVTTLDPKQEFSGNVSATYANLDTVGGTMYVTGGLAPSLAADLAVYYNDQQEGFGRDLTTGTEVGQSDDLAVRSKWRLDISDDTTLRITGDYGHLGFAQGRRTTYGSLPVGDVPFTGGPFDTLQNVDPVFRNDQWGTSANLVSHFSAFDFISITAYRDARTRDLFDVDGTQLALGLTDILFKEHQLTQELQLVSTVSGPLNWTVGAFYFDGAGAYEHVVVNVPPAIQTFQTHQKTQSPAAYAQATYKFDTGTSLTLGARDSGEKRDFDGNGDIFTKATRATAFPPPASGELTVNRPTWRVALDQRLSPDVLGYVSYNRGFKSGGFNGATFLAAQSFKPETLDAYEVGFKSDLFDRRARLNGAAFYYDYRNIQLTSFSSPGVVDILNAAAAKIYGLDADLTARLIEPLTLTAGVSYIHSRFGDYPNAQIGRPLPTGGNVIVEGSATGNELPMTPEYTVDLGLDYAMAVSGGSLLASTHYYYSDGWLAEPDNRLKQGAYGLLNASLTWKVGSAERLSFSGWGKNLTNKVYATTLQTQTTSDVMVPAPGRTFGITVGYLF